MDHKIVIKYDHLDETGSEIKHSSAVGSRNDNVQIKYRNEFKILRASESTVFQTLPDTEFSRVSSVGIFRSLAHRDSRNLTVVERL